jgi:hypothetical protein
MHHPNLVLKYPGTTQELALEIARLRYDALAEFLNELSGRIASDAHSDMERGREKLAQELTQAAICIRNAWTICKPFMLDPIE